MRWADLISSYIHTFRLLSSNQLHSLNSKCNIFVFRLVGRVVLLQFLVTLSQAVIGLEVCCADVAAWQDTAITASSKQKHWVTSGPKNSTKIQKWNDTRSNDASQTPGVRCGYASKRNWVNVYISFHVDFIFILSESINVRLENEPTVKSQNVHVEMNESFESRCWGCDDHNLLLYNQIKKDTICNNTVFCIKLSQIKQDITNNCKIM